MTITLDEVIVVWEQVQNYGGRHNLYGTPDKDIHRGRLKGILSRATSHGGDVFDYAGRLWYRIIDEQPFSGCNKRTATALMDLILQKSGYSCIASDEETAEWVNSYSGVRPGEEED